MRQPEAHNLKTLEKPQALALLKLRGHDQREPAMPHSYRLAQANARIVRLARACLRTLALRQMGARAWLAGGRDPK